MSYLSAKMQSLYSAAPAMWTDKNLIFLINPTQTTVNEIVPLYSQKQANHVTLKSVNSVTSRLDATYIKLRGFSSLSWATSQGEGNRISDRFYLSLERHTSLSSLLLNWFV